MKVFDRSIMVLFAALVLTMSACGNPLKNSSTDDVSYTPQPLGMDYCYNCHNRPGSTQAYEQIFEKWLGSRHANLNENPSLPGPSYLLACLPCHNGEVIEGDIGGRIFDTTTYGVLFTDPTLGDTPRPVIDCEACHISGQGHFGSSSPPQVAIPAFPECTRCHPPTEDMISGIEVFAGADDIDHHDMYSSHMWSYGNTTIGDLLPSGPPVAFISSTTRTLASIPFQAYMISATWMAANGSTWYFDGHETINDTHYQGIWVTSEKNEVLVYEVPTSKFGYVDLTNTSPNTGMVRADSSDSCTASCHSAHEFDLTINEQWFEGAHHPNIEGPVGTTTSRGQEVLDIPGPANWGAVDHGFDAECLRCHTSMGFAEVAPGYGDAVEIPGGQSDGFITCNACHDGINYPTPGNKRLRFTGSVDLFDYEGGTLAEVDAGNSAVCVYCHQGRSDRTELAAMAAAWVYTNMPLYAASPDEYKNPVEFVGSHLLPGGAVFYGVKGYEYSGMPYEGAHFHSQVFECVGCHMADDPISDEVGGHTFHVAQGGTEATDFCKNCHPNNMNFQYPWGVTTFSPMDNVSSMLDSLKAAILAFDHPNDLDTLPDIKASTGRYPFVTQTGQAWSPPVAAAIYNWDLISEDPGAYAHNWKYAVQLLRDSYNDLATNQDPGAPGIPALSGTRP